MFLEFITSFDWGYLFSCSGNNPNESLGDFLTPTDEVTAVASTLPHLVPTPETEIKQVQPEEEKVPETKAKLSRRTRTSQRQLDRELKEEAERIRKENQELLKKEKEAMKKQVLAQKQAEPSQVRL